MIYVKFIPQKTLHDIRDLRQIIIYAELLTCTKTIILNTILDKLV